MKNYETKGNNSKKDTMKATSSLSGVPAQVSYTIEEWMNQITERNDNADNDEVLFMLYDLDKALRQLNRSHQYWKDQLVLVQSIQTERDKLDHETRHNASFQFMKNLQECLLKVAELQETTSMSEGDNPSTSTRALVHRAFQHERAAVLHEIRTLVRKEDHTVEVMRNIMDYFASHINPCDDKDETKIEPLLRLASLRQFLLNINDETTSSNLTIDWMSIRNEANMLQIFLQERYREFEENEDDLSFLLLQNVTSVHDMLTRIREVWIPVLQPLCHSLLVPVGDYASVSSVSSNRLSVRAAMFRSSSAEEVADALEEQEMIQQNLLDRKQEWDKRFINEQQTLDDWKKRVEIVTTEVLSFKERVEEKLQDRFVSKKGATANVKIHLPILEEP